MAVLRAEMVVVARRLYGLVEKCRKALVCVLGHCCRRCTNSHHSHRQVGGCNHHRQSTHLGRIHHRDRKVGVLAVLSRSWRESSVAGNMERALRLQMQKAFRRQVSCSTLKRECQKTRLQNHVLTWGSVPKSRERQNFVSSSEAGVEPALTHHIFGRMCRQSCRMVEKGQGSHGTFQSHLGQLTGWNLRVLQVLSTSAAFSSECRASSSNAEQERKARGRPRRVTMIGSGITRLKLGTQRKRNDAGRAEPADCGDF